MHEWKSFSEQSFFCNQILISGLNLKHNLKSCNLQCKPWGKIKSCYSRGYKKVAKGSRFLRQKRFILILDQRSSFFIWKIRNILLNNILEFLNINSWHPNFLAGHNRRVSEVLKCIWNLAIIDYLNFGITLTLKSEK